MKLYLLLLILFLSGCSVNMLNLGLASTDRIDLNDNYERVSQINSKYRTYILLYFPMGNPPRMDTLIGKAMRENDVDLITNEVDVALQSAGRKNQAIRVLKELLNEN